MIWWQMVFSFCRDRGCAGTGLWTSTQQKRTHGQQEPCWVTPPALGFLSHKPSSGKGTNKSLELPRICVGQGSLGLLAGAPLLGQSLTRHVQVVQLSTTHVSFSPKKRPSCRHPDTFRILWGPPMISRKSWFSLDCGAKGQGSGTAWTAGA